MSQQDWQPVGWNRPPRAAVKQTQAKEGRPGDKATRRLADATEAQAVPQMPLSVGKTLSQARAARGITQAKLAQQTCVPAKVIQEYEAGKGQPNPLLLQRLGRALGVRLSTK